MTPGRHIYHVCATHTHSCYSMPYKFPLVPFAATIEKDLSSFTEPRKATWSNKTLSNDRNQPLSVLCSKATCHKAMEYLQCH